MPSGPSSTAVPSLTSTTVQPGIVAGFVSGAATRGCRIAIAAAEGLALAWEAGLTDGRAPAGNRADGLGMLPVTAGASEAGAAFSAPSLFSLCLGSENRGKGAGFCATSIKPRSPANWGPFQPPAPPRPNPT